MREHDGKTHQWAITTLERIYREERGVQAVGPSSNGISHTLPTLKAEGRSATNQGVHAYDHERASNLRLGETTKELRLLATIDQQTKAAIDAYHEALRREYSRQTRLPSLRNQANIYLASEEPTAPDQRGWSAKPKLRYLGRRE